MDIRLLGPVEVLDEEGQPVPLTAPMLCTTLAALALRPGEHVRADDLIDRVWGPVPPPSAVATLRTYVMRLRRVLPPGRLRTTSGGYRLAVQPDATDVGRLREILQQVQRTRSTAPESALRLLEEAHRLGRGTPLGGVVDCALRTDELPRLEDLMLSAAEERFALRLEVGGHAVVLDELSAAVSSHPLRERFAAQFMVALHRSGRRAEALNVYSDARRRLMAELGVEPGAELRRSQQMVLHGEAPDRPDTAATPAEPAQTSAPEVREWAPGVGSRHLSTGETTPVLAPRAAEFVGRGSALAQLRGWLHGRSAGPVVCLLDGQGGVGKSTLATRIAQEVADTFADGVLYLNLHGADTQNPPLEPDQALRLLLPALGVSGAEMPNGTALLADLYRQRMAGRHFLLILDNASTTEQVAPLLPVTPGCAALVTSRAVLAGVDGGRYLHLDPLDTADAVRLMQSVAVSSPDLGSVEEWERLAEFCGHLPLALSILATRIAARPHWRMAEWIGLLSDERTRIGQFAAAGREQDLRASLLVSVQQLAEAEDPTARLAARVFPLLGTAPVRVHTAGSVAALAGCSRDEAQAALERLTDAQITGSPRRGVHTLHDLVRSAAVWQAADVPQEATRMALARLARWYAGTLYRLNEHLPTTSARREVCRDGAARFPEGEETVSQTAALSWADEALRDVIALAGRLAEEPPDDTELGGDPLAVFGREACRALEAYFSLRLRWREQRRLCDLTLAVGRRDGDGLAQGLALTQLGKLSGQQGDGARGAELLHDAVAILREYDAELLALTAEGGLVPCLGLTGRYNEAITLGHRVMEECERAGFPTIWENLNNLARCYLHLGETDAALRYLTHSYRSAELPYARALAAGGITECHLVRHAYPEAADWAGRALAQTEGHLFDLTTEAHLYSLRGHALRQLGDEDGAQRDEEWAQQALETLSRRESRAVRLQLVPEAMPDAVP